MIDERSIKDLTIAHVLRKQARERGDKLFIDYLTDGRQYSFADAHLLSNRIGNSLLAMGIGKGTHVANVIVNCPEQILLYFALAKIGAVSIPINTGAKGSFLEYYLTQSDSTVAVVDESLLANLVDVLPATRISHIIVIGTAGAQEVPGATFVPFDDLLTGDPGDPPVDVLYSDMAAINYTSGTTGPSKGNVYTQAAGLHFAMNLMDMLGATADDIYYVCFPLFHASAWNSAVLPMLQLGGGVALTRRFSAQNYLPEARQSGATIFNLLSVGSFLLSQPPSPADRDHKLRIGLAAPMPVNAEEFEKRFGVVLTGAFGLSDYACPFGLRPADRHGKRHSVGTPFDQCEVRLVDEEDFEVPTGVPGELVLRHRLPWVTPTGYYKMPEVTSESRRNLWFHTGDRMMRDEDGFYFFVDRKKDAIRRRGENISSFEVESAIARLGGIAEVAVVGIRASTGEDDVGVAIVRAEGSGVTEAMIANYCDKQLPAYMQPRFILFMDAFPKTLTEKIEKHKIRSLMQEKAAEIWDREAVPAASPAS